MKNFSIGIDVSKEKIDLTVKKVHFGLEQPENLLYGVYENAPIGFRKMLKEIEKATGSKEPKEWLFCLETTGAYELRLCDYLYARGYDVWRESALQIKLSSGITKSKNDKIDSERIADYAIRHMDKAVIYETENEQVRTLKALFLYRERLVTERVSKLNSSKEIKYTQVMNDEMRWMQIRSKQDIERLSKEIKECDEHILRVIQSCESINHHYEIMTSVKGIGLIAATALIVYTGDFKQITNARKACSYCGIAPFFAQSGTSVHHEKYVKHLSNPRLKAYLTQSALSAIKYDETIATYYHRLRESGKGARISINNVRNKLIRIIYALIQNDTYYEANHEDIRATQLKLAS